MLLLSCLVTMSEGAGAGEKMNGSKELVRVKGKWVQFLKLLWDLGFSLRVEGSC